MAENRKQQHERSGKGIPADKHIPVNDDENTTVAEPSPRGHEARGIQKGIADADKMARTGSVEETVRDTPPAGAWNDTSSD